MYSLTRYLRSISASPSLRSSFGGRKWVSQFPFNSDDTSGNTGVRETTEQRSLFPGGIGSNPDSFVSRLNTSSSYLQNLQSFTNSGERRDFGQGRPSRSMEFVRGALEGDARERTGMPMPYQQSFELNSQFRRNFESNADFVHIKMHKNNTFVIVTDSKGNVKCQASSGCLPELKGGPKLSRYAAEATAEYVGRKAKEMGLKSVVVKVNGFVHFKKKRQAIMSFREGFTNSRSDQNPIVHIEDTTRRPHNGCRLPKKRRV